MNLHLVLSALSCSLIHASQIILGQDESPSNFIHKSIFGRREFDSSLPDPVILAPTYKSREYDTFDDDYSYAGLSTFAHLDFVDCTKPANDGTFDIGIVGHPFDLGVSYRPGARSGPSGARSGARRISPAGGYRWVTCLCRRHRSCRYT